MLSTPTRPAVPQKRDRGATLARAASVLNAVATHRADHGVTLTELSRELKLHKSTAHRLLLGLEQIGFVERYDEGEHYRLGLRLVELAGKYLDDSNLVKESSPILYGAMQESGETVHVAILDGTDVVYLAKVDGIHSVRLHSRIGDRRPAVTTSLGKAIMAYRPASQVEGIIASGLPPRTPKSITVPNLLWARLEEVRANGYAVDDEETALGVRCVAAPIFDYQGDVIAAVSISGPTMRVVTERVPELGELVKTTAYRISQRMGYSR
ncbi:MAG: IclR family transcriptional regulator [Chloroflexota bacterium]